MQPNFIWRGYVIVLAATLMLLLFSVLQTQVPLLNEVMVPYGPWSGELMAADTSKSTHQFVEMPPEGIQDMSGDSLPQPNPMASEQGDHYQGLHHLETFFAWLGRTKSGKGRTRIAYFGDSMIEGDLVTQSLRNSLQTQFGGQGVGFVSLTSIAPGFRRTIRHEFSPNWKHFSFLRKNPTDYKFGISGEFFIPEDSVETDAPWVKFKTSSIYPQTKIFRDIKLYYGNVPESNGKLGYVKVTTGHKSHSERTDSLELAIKSTVNELKLAGRPTKDARISFFLEDKIPIYGLSFEDKEGVYLDNFSVRGHSGMQMTSVKSNVLARFQTYMDYKLVILHFGLNVVNANDPSFAYYKKRMLKVVKHMKRNMPDVSFLVISVTDKSENVDGEMKTQATVPVLVKIQEEVARESGVSFFNLYEAMGGKNSMVKWVEGDPSLANTDYTHVNRRGAEKVSKMIERFLMEAFEQYEQQSDQLAEKD